MGEQTSGSRGTQKSKDDRTDSSGVVPRRDFLRVSAVTLGLSGMGAVAGRSRETVPAVQAGSVPSYANWVPEGTPFSPGNNLLVDLTSVDMSTFLGVLSIGETESDGDEGGEEINTVQFEPVSKASLIAIFSLSFIDELGLSDPIVGQSVNFDNPDPNPDDVSEFSTPTDRFISVGEINIYSGSYDSDAITTAAEQGGLTETSTAGFYTGTYFGQEVTLTWTADYVVTGPNRDLISTAIETWEGQRPRLHEQNSDFARLVAEGGNGDFAALSLAEGTELQVSQEDIEAYNLDYSPIQNTPVQGYAQSLDYNLDQRVVTATSVFSHSSENQVDEQTLSAIGSEADESSLSRDGRFVTIESTYRGGAIVGEQEDSDTDGDDGDDSTDGDDGDDIGEPGVDGDDSMDGDDGDDSTDGGDSTNSEGDGDDGGDSMDGDDSTDGDDGDGSTDGGGDGDNGDDGGGSDDSGPGFGLLPAAAGLGGAGYMLSRRLGTDTENETE